jgi:type IV pilus assembly protein PilE
MHNPRLLMARGAAEGNHGLVFKAHAVRQMIPVRQATCSRVLTLFRGRRAIRGFSLVELMIVVAIIGVLAAMSLPVFRDYQVSSVRAAAKAALLDIASRQEQYLIQNRAYASSLSALGYTLSAEVSGAYTVYTCPVDTIAECDADGKTAEFTNATTVAVPIPRYVTVATPTAGGVMAEDDVLTLNQFGFKTGKW